MCAAGGSPGRRRRCRRTRRWPAVTKVVGWTAGVGAGSAAAVQPARPTEEDLVVVPEPDAEADERPRVGTDDSLDALEPRERQGREQGEQDVREGSEAAMPPADTAHTGLPGLRRPAGPGPRAGARYDRSLELVERRVPVRAHVVGQEAVVVPARPAQQHVDHRTIPIEPPGSLPVRDHRRRAGRARHGGKICPARGVAVAAEAREG